MIERFLNRSSVRKYKNKKIDESEVLKMIDIINSSPTSINGHHFSAIIVSNDNLKNQLSKIGVLQKHIDECSLFVIFNIDLSSVKSSFKDTDELINKNIINELVLTSAVDATISCTMLQDYCINQGFGTCFIGAIRHNIKNVRKTLNLPDNVFPLLGLTIGYSDEDNKFVKPKFNKVFFNDDYSNKELNERYDEYEKTMDDFYNKKYPEIKSRAFYEQIRRFYSDNSIFKEWMDLDEINKIFKNVL